MHTHVAVKGLLLRHIHPMDIIIVFLKIPYLPIFPFPLMLCLFLFPGSQNQLMPQPTNARTDRQTPQLVSEFIKHGSMLFCVESSEPLEYWTETEVYHKTKR